MATLLLLLSVLPHLPYLSVAVRLTDEHRLMDNLLGTYDNSGRPVYNASHTVTVKFGFTLAQISDMRVATYLYRHRNNENIARKGVLDKRRAIRKGSGLLQYIIPAAAGWITGTYNRQDIRILYQDEVNQVLTTNVWIEQEWQDERLKWDPADYNGLAILRIPCHKIWLPDIVLYNSADDFTTGYMQSKAMVDYNGTVFWSPPAKLRSSCKIDITYFPFDDQVCIMKFGSWTYDGFQVDITNRSDKVDLENYVFSGEWKLLGIDIVRNERYYACCKEPYPDVIFTIKIQRKTLYYLFNVVFPCLWLSALSLLGFWLPPDTGEKITLGITVLLAFSVFMLLIAENMPATSEFVPLIGLYLTMTMGMTSLSIILTVFVLQIHHVGPHQKPVPRWLRFLIFRMFARGVCLYANVAVGNYDKEFERVDYAADDACSVRLIEQTDERTSNYNGIARHLTESNGEDLTAVDTKRNKEHAVRFDDYSDRDRDYTTHYDDYYVQNKDLKVWNADSKKRETSYELDSRDFTSSGTTPDQTRRKQTKRMRTRFRRLTNRQEAEDDFQRVVNEWRLLAVIIDRVLFWTFLLCIVVATLTILLILPLFKPKI